MTLEATRPTIPAARYGERLERVRGLVREGGLAALLVGVGADLRYLTGYPAMESERLTMLVVPAAGPCRLLVPRLELLPARLSAAAATGAVEVVPWQETDDTHALVAGFARAGAGDGATDLAVAMSDRLWAMHVLGIQRALPGARVVLGSTVMRNLRIRKDPEEIALLTLAAQAADRVVGQIAAGRLIGRTEAEVSREVGERLVTEGHDHGEFGIVASGPNSASPHHGASDRVIGPGEPIVLDIGGTLGGYGSDITRTLWVTGGDPANWPDAEYQRLFDLVRAAQARGTEAARAGASAESVDAAARAVIVAGGYGPQFIHRLGHGIGMEGHEDPYLVTGNRETLAVGMTFSIEPGIYVEGRHGARIEDIVVCGPDGPVSLNEAPRDLAIVDG